MAMWAETGIIALVTVVDFFLVYCGWLLGDLMSGEGNSRSPTGTARNGNKATLQTCDLCDKQGVAEDDFISFVFNGFNICEGCKMDLEKLIIVEKEKDSE